MFSPRLARLLQILLADQTPVTVAELAERLEVSRRTVARELAAAGRALASLGLAIECVPGQGFALRGNAPQLHRLRLATAKHARGRPSNREERRWHLAIGLLTQAKQGKMLSYARAFAVSEATISGDLNALTPWLGGFGLNLVRRPGQGVFLEGREMDRRSAIVAALDHLDTADAVSPPYPGPHAWRAVEDLASGPARTVLKRFSLESAAALRRYLAVAAQRLADCHPLTTADFCSSCPPDQADPTADLLADLVEDFAGIEFPPIERAGLSLRVAASRSAFSSAGPAPVPEEEFDGHILGLAYRMIEAYNASLAQVLKLDEQLVSGLAAHLQALRVRLENSFQLDDPLAAQIAEAYPEILAGAHRALTVLNDHYARIPDSEASFLAAHFGAAELRMAQRSDWRPKVRLGVVCAHGVGTSYLLLTQLQQRFSADAVVELCPETGPATTQHFDLIVTSLRTDPAATSLESSPPVLSVQPIMTPTDLGNVALAISTVAARSSAPAPEAKPGRLAEVTRAIGGLTDAVTVVVDSFTVFPLEGGTLDEIIGEVAQRFGAAGRLEVIGRALRRREELSSQVIGELELILLHARIDGLDKPTLAVGTPPPGGFRAAELAGISSCLIMLMPSEAGPDVANLFGLVSSELIANRDFLTAIQQGDSDAALPTIERIAQDHLLSTINRLLP